MQTEPEYLLPDLTLQGVSRDKAQGHWHWAQLLPKGHSLGISPGQKDSFG